MVNKIYTKESEQRLLVYLKHGDSKSALHFLNDIFAEIYTMKESDYSSQLFVFYDILGTLIKFSSSIGVSKQFFLNSNEVIGSNDITEAKAILYDWVEEVCALSKSIENLFDAKIEQIIDLVHEEYNNPLFNVSFVADKLGITINYLSSYFKSKTGHGLSGYITSYRLNKACELIEQGVSVTKTYRICGFSDLNTFIRTFKKKYGTTPGKFKK